jgi:hypothetical protein
MRNIITVITLVVLMSAVLPVVASAQSGASVFVVYGTKYEDDGETPEAVDYLITVENLSKERTSTLVLGENDGVGRYSVTWVGYLGSPVVDVGDEIRVMAEKDGLVFGTIYTIELADIAESKVMLDMYWEDIAVETGTWGAIKSMYK